MVSAKAIVVKITFTTSPNTKLVESDVRGPIQEQALDSNGYKPRLRGGARSPRGMHWDLHANLRTPHKAPEWSPDMRQPSHVSILLIRIYLTLMLVPFPSNNLMDQYPESRRRKYWLAGYEDYDPNIHKPRSRHEMTTIFGIVPEPWR